MANLTEAEKKEMRDHEKRCRQGFPITPAEEARYEELEKKGRQNYVPPAQASPKSIWDLPVAKWAFTCDARDMGW